MPKAKLALVVSFLFAVGCDLDLPRDPRGTLARARGGPLRVGVAPAGEWVRVAGEAAEPRGIEPEILRRFAATLDAEIKWVRGGEGELLAALERFEVDVVLAGLTSDSPWKDRVGFTRPYLRAGGGERTIAVAPGENALLLELERFLASEEDLVARLAPETVR